MTAPPETNRGLWLDRGRAPVWGLCGGMATARNPGLSSPWLLNVPSESCQALQSHPHSGRAQATYTGLEGG